MRWDYISFLSHDDDDDYYYFYFIIIIMKYTHSHIFFTVHGENA